jgi:hypothetical protein
LRMHIRLTAANGGRMMGGGTCCLKGCPPMSTATQLSVLVADPDPDAYLLYVATLQIDERHLESKRPMDAMRWSRRWRRR